MVIRNFQATRLPRSPTVNSFRRRSLKDLSCRCHSGLMVDSASSTFVRIVCDTCASIVTEGVILESRVDQILEITPEQFPHPY